MLRNDSNPLLYVGIKSEYGVCIDSISQTHQYSSLPTFPELYPNSANFGKLLFFTVSKLVSTCCVCLQHRVQFTQHQYDFRCYFHLLIIWNELCAILAQSNWSTQVHTTSCIDDACVTDPLTSLFQFIFQLILESNNHPILNECSRSNELTEEDGDLPYENEVGVIPFIDDMTGDYEEIPTDGYSVHSEYDHLIHQSILLLSKLLDFSSVYQQNIGGFYAFCYDTLQKAVVLINQPEWTTELQDCSTVLRVVSNVSFGEHNIDILILLSTLIKYLFVALIHRVNVM